MEPEPGCIVSLLSFPPILLLKAPFGPVRPSSHLTLYIMVDITHITPPNLYYSPQVYQPKITILAPKKLLYRDAFNFPPPNTANLSKLAILYLTVGEMLPASTKNPRFALHPADRVTKRIVPINRSNTWERAIGRIKWVMNTLS